MSCLEKSECHIVMKSPCHEMSCHEKSCHEKSCHEKSCLEKSVSHIV